MSTCRLILVVSIIYELILNCFFVCGIMMVLAVNRLWGHSSPGYIFNTGLRNQNIRSAQISGQEKYMLFFLGSRNAKKMCQTYSQLISNLKLLECQRSLLKVKYTVGKGLKRSFQRCIKLDFMVFLWIYNQINMSNLRPKYLCLGQNNTRNVILQITIIHLFLLLFTVRWNLAHRWKALFKTFPTVCCI